LSVFEHVRVPLSEVNRALDGSQFATAALPMS
jgi:hypothetical protein